ncbi:MAG: hypothetical protein AAFO07_08055 [Bacteroidota bacterium]
MENVLSSFSSKHFLMALLLGLVLVTACKKEDSFTTPAMPELNAQVSSQDPIVRTTPGTAAIELPQVDELLCELSPITRADITPESPIQELTDGNGFSISGGDLSINIKGREVFLKGLDATFRFCDNNRLIAIEGTAGIPSPIECIDFGDAVGTKIGFFTGSVINESLGLDFELPADRAYFVFTIETQLGVNICTNLDNPESRPVRIEIPKTGLSFQFITDFTDPFYYLEVPKMAVANSSEGVFQYQPIQSIPEFEPFNARTYVSGTYPMYGVLQVNGHLYQNLPSIIGQLASDNPFDFPIEEGYRGGINAYIDLSLPIGGKKKKKKDDKDGNSGDKNNDNTTKKDSSNLLSKILSFNIPLGQASAAIRAELVEGQFLSKAFINTLIQPDNSWWPNFIPAKPNGALNVQGFLQQDGEFRIGLRGEMGIQKSNNEADLINCVGTLQADNEQLLLRGELNGINEGWAVQATIADGETDMRLEIPESITADLGTDLEAEVAALEKLVADLQKKLEEAEDQLQIELSLRGLRTQLPGIVQTIEEEMDQGIAAGKKKAKDIINKSALCEKNDVYRYVCDKIDAAAKPYYQVLEALNAAVRPELSDEAARIQLEKALRDVIALPVLKVNISYKTKVAKYVKVFRKRIRVCVNYIFKHTFSERLISNAQIASLKEAADNVTRIQPASDLVLDLASEMTELPTLEIIDKVKNLPEPNLEQVGYIVNKREGTYQYYVAFNGKTHYKDFDPFSWSSIVKAIRGKRLEKVE